MSNKIVYVKKSKINLIQRLVLIMYTLMGYEIQFIKNDNNCKGRRANVVIEDYLDFDFINTDEILK